ncbi:MAG: winged helix-turn-helix domain-containing protein, partial [Chitinophagaceae bacterium]
MAKSIRHILNKKNKFAIKVSIWIECSDEGFFGPGPLELLERINKTGSISQAAKQMKMSYKKAWEMISTRNTQASKTICYHSNRVVKKGGGSISVSRLKNHQVNSDNNE